MRNTSQAIGRKPGDSHQLKKQLGQKQFLLSMHGNTPVKGTAGW